MAKKKRPFRGHEHSVGFGHKKYAKPSWMISLRKIALVILGIVLMLALIGMVKHLIYHYL